MKKIKLPPIGLRTLKTGLAIFLCLLLFPNEPFFACITAIFCLQNTIEASYRIGLARVYGTIHGSIIGLLSLIIYRFIWDHVKSPFLCKLLIYLLIATGIIVVIYTCTLMNKHLSVTLACIVFLGITTIHAQSDALYYGINRIIETFFGLFIGLSVNKFVTPPKHSQKN